MYIYVKDPAHIQKQWEIAEYQPWGRTWRTGEIMNGFSS